MIDTVEKIELPPVSAGALFRHRNTINDILLSMHDKVMRSDSLLSLATVIASRIKSAKPGKTHQVPSATISPQCYHLALHKTLEDHCYGKTLTVPFCSYLATRLAGNIHRLQLGLPLPRWSGLPESYWAMAIVREARAEYVYSRKHGSIPGIKLVLLILSGHAAGEHVEHFGTYSWIKNLMRKVGLSSADGYKFLVGTRFFVELSGMSEVSISRYHETGTLTGHNRALFTARTVDRNCPQKFTHPCTECPIGYEDCQLATHRYTYNVLECPQCKEISWFRKDAKPDAVCNTCVKENENAPISSPVCGISDR